MRAAVSAAMTVNAMKREARWCWVFAWRYALSGLLLSVVSVSKADEAHAEAPAPSQEFWNYFVEFGDAQGELFDPADYAAVANLPKKAKQEIDKALKASKPEQVPHESRATQEQSQ